MSTGVRITRKNSCVHSDPQFSPRTFAFVQWQWVPEVTEVTQWRCKDLLFTEKPLRLPAMSPKRDNASRRLRMSELGLAAHPEGAKIVY